MPLNPPPPQTTKPHPNSFSRQSFGKSAWERWTSARALDLGTLAADLKEFEGSYSTTSRSLDQYLQKWDPEKHINDQPEDDFTVGRNKVTVSAGIARIRAGLHKMEIKAEQVAAEAKRKLEEWSSSETYPAPGVEELINRLAAVVELGFYVNKGGLFRKEYEKKLYESHTEVEADRVRDRLVGELVDLLTAVARKLVAEEELALFLPPWKSETLNKLMGSLSSCATVIKEKAARVWPPPAPVSTSAKKNASANLDAEYAAEVAAEEAAHDVLDALAQARRAVLSARVHHTAEEAKRSLGDVDHCGATDSKTALELSEKALSNVIGLLEASAFDETAMNDVAEIRGVAELVPRFVAALKMIAAECKGRIEGNNIDPNDKNVADATRGQLEKLSRIVAKLAEHAPAYPAEFNRNSCTVAIDALDAIATKLIAAEELETLGAAVEAFEEEKEAAQGAVAPDLALAKKACAVLDAESGLDPEVAEEKLLAATTLLAKSFGPLVDAWQKAGHNDEGGSTLKGHWTNISRLADKVLREGSAGREKYEADHGAFPAEDGQHVLMVYRLKSAQKELKATLSTDAKNISEISKASGVLEPLINDAAALKTIYARCPDMVNGANALLKDSAVALAEFAPKPTAQEEKRLETERAEKKRQDEILKEKQRAVQTQKQELKDHEAMHMENVVKGYELDTQEQQSKARLAELVKTEKGCSDDSELQRIAKEKIDVKAKMAEIKAERKEHDAASAETKEKLEAMRAETRHQQEEFERAQAEVQAQEEALRKSQQQAIDDIATANDHSVGLLGQLEHEIQSLNDGLAKVRSVGGPTPTNTTKRIFTNPHASTNTVARLATPTTTPTLTLATNPLGPPPPPPDGQARVVLEPRREHGADALRDGTDREEVQVD